MEEFWAGNAVNHRALPSMCEALGSVKSVRVYVIYACIYTYKLIYI